MFQQASSLVLLAVVTVATPAPAMQIRGTISGGRPAAPRTLIMIANPYATAAADSALAIAIGSAWREKLDRTVGTDYRIITRKEMNDALTTFGYGSDGLLTPLAAGQLARQFTARYYVTSTMAKSAAGYTITARLIGTNIDVGQVMSVTGTAGPELGSKLADATAPAIRALADAKLCNELAADKPVKAVEAANKAIKSVPNYGLAEYCLAEMAMKTDPVGADAMLHLQNTVKGDPYSLAAMDQISQIYQKKGDSTKTIETFQQMLRAAPTNKALLEQAFKLFLRYGKPEAAMSVADEGIKQDPANPDWYDLKSNVCITKEDYTCAVAALVEVFNADSARADSSFFNKILFAASQKPDTAKYLVWGLKATARYPDNAGLLEELAKAYSLAGQTDSTVAVTQRLVKIDPSKTDAVLRVVQQLIDAKKPGDAMQFAPSIKQYGDEDAKNNFSNLTLQAMQVVAGATPRDNALLVLMGEASLSVGPTNPNILVFTNYFYAVGLQAPLSELATAVRSQKSCELAKKEQDLLGKLEPAVTIAATSSNAGVSAYAKQLLASVQSEKPAVKEIIGQLCR
jgi:tetratricopeptide (TPR) repeat protein